jgi:hypothetical protein
MANAFAFTGVIPKVHNCPFDCDSKYNELKKEFDKLETLYNDCYINDQAKREAIKTLENQNVWFQMNQLAYAEKIRVLKRDLEITSNELKFCEKEKAKVDLEKQELQDKFDKEVAGRMKWQEGSKHLEKLINSSQSTRSKRALGYEHLIGPHEVYDTNESSVFDPEPPLQFQNPVKYVKEGGMNTVAPPIRGTFKPTSPHYPTDLDESQLTYGKKSSDLPDLNCKTNDFVSCSNIDKSSDLKSTDYASCDSSDKSDTPKTDDLSSKVANNESNSKTASFDKFVCKKQSCVKNKSFKKKSCFVCGSKSHLIKDCDYHEKRMGMYADQKRPRPMWTNSIANKQFYLVLDPTFFNIDQ